MHASQFRKVNTPGKPLLAICGDARSRRLGHRQGHAHLDHRFCAFEVLKLKALVARQDLDVLPWDTFRERALPGQVLDEDGSAARSQKHVHAVARRI